MVQNKVNMQTPLFRRWNFFGSWCSGGNFRGSNHYENSYIQKWALVGHFFVEKKISGWYFYPMHYAPTWGVKIIQKIWCIFAQLIKGLQVLEFHKNSCLNALHSCLLSRHYQLKLDSSYFINWNQQNHPACQHSHAKYLYAWLYSVHYKSTSVLILRNVVL